MVFRTVIVDAHAHVILLAETGNAGQRFMRGCAHKLSDFRGFQVFKAGLDRLVRVDLEVDRASVGELNASIAVGLSLGGHAAERRHRQVKVRFDIQVRDLRLPEHIHHLLRRELAKCVGALAELER